MTAKDEKHIEEPSTFLVRDCALVVLATGKSAQNLRELRDGIREVPQSSIYHHFWGRLLQPQFDEPEYSNDFASWSHRALNDKALAERLSVVDPIDYVDIEELREELVDIIEQRLDESEVLYWAQADQQFHFLQGQIVVFDTGRRVVEPAELAQVVPSLSAGSVFYHFIDARRRTEESIDDFSGWLEGYGERYRELIDQLGGIDPCFSSLSDVREMLTRILETHFLRREE